MECLHNGNFLAVSTGLMYERLSLRGRLNEQLTYRLLQNDRRAAGDNVFVLELNLKD